VISLPRGLAAGPPCTYMCGMSEPRNDAERVPEPKPSDKPVAPRPKEVGGPAGPEPTRYGDWERKGRVSDF